MSFHETLNQDYWKKCNSCKKTLPYRSNYWVCNVSTCNRKRTGLIFCSVSCWDAHNPLMNHRDSWAVEKKAPSFQEYRLALENDETQNETPNKTSNKTSDAMTEKKMTNSIPQDTDPTTMEEDSDSSSTASGGGGSSSEEILIVATKLKNYIRTKSSMNTSAGVFQVLSDRVRALCDEAIEKARQSGRKTVMDRDFL